MNKNDHSNSDRVTIILPRCLGGETVYAVREVQLGHGPGSTDRVNHNRWQLVTAAGGPVALFSGRTSPHLRDVRQWIAEAARRT